jgi:hypothetical protein
VIAINFGGLGFGGKCRFLSKVAEVLGFGRKYAFLNPVE